MISENNDMYKKWYYEEREKSNQYWEQLREESHKAALLTGYLSGVAKWNTNVPNQDRIKILGLLIEIYEPKVDSNELYSRWVSEWKEFKSDLEK